MELQLITVIDRVNAEHMRSDNQNGLFSCKNFKSGNLCIRNSLTSSIQIRFASWCGNFSFYSEMMLLLLLL
ncbi:hypothetical protein LWI28_002650 [Acer negundo]|uniref:Uncharacterized protein n=1 Tax=Acer negundo TaxID=4023 RepID=A0AAD5ICK7_ACENE|nr:hypothetical protein LWI28_002650 [Acer negundo]